MRRLCGNTEADEIIIPIPPPALSYEQLRHQIHAQKIKNAGGFICKTVIRRSSKNPLIS